MSHVSLFNVAKRGEMHKPFSVQIHPTFLLYVYSVKPFPICSHKNMN